jgi:UDP-2,3-diacylglucosamine pyrophosphatase LpxH
MERRLDELYMNADIINYDPGKNFVFFSDLHIGARRPNDSFQPNEGIFLRALDYYKDWTICLGGDIWDLWKNVSLPECMNSYPKVVSDFDFAHTQIVGNHDRELEHKYKEAY